METNKVKNDKVAYKVYLDGIDWYKDHLEWKRNKKTKKMEMVPFKMKYDVILTVYRDKKYKNLQHVTMLGVIAESDGNIYASSLETIFTLNDSKLLFDEDVMSSEYLITKVRVPKERIEKIFNDYFSGAVDGFVLKI